MGTYRIKVVPPSVGSTIVTVESTGEMSRFPGHTRTIKVRFRRPSWSEYTVIANDNMRFGQGTEVYGKVESNLGIRFDGTAHNMCRVRLLRTVIQIMLAGANLACIRM